MPARHRGATAEFEASAARNRGQEQYVLRLYVTGMTFRSTEAIARVRDICERYLQGRYELAVIDLYQQPELARVEQIVAAPTLIKKLPAPVRRLIGNLAAEERVLLGLDITRNQAK